MTLRQSQPLLFNLFASGFWGNGKISANSFPPHINTLILLCLSLLPFSLALSEIRAQKSWFECFANIRIICEGNPKEFCDGTAFANLPWLLCRNFPKLKLISINHFCAWTTTISSLRFFHHRKLPHWSTNEPQWSNMYYARKPSSLIRESHQNDYLGDIRGNCVKKIG